MADKKSNKKKIGLFILYGAITIAVLCIFLSANDFGAIMSVLGGADIKYVLIAIGLLAVYAALTPLTTCILAKSKKLNVSFGTTYCISMTEHFFNGITPFSTGGQPFQMYEFSRAKVKVADSTGVLLLNFIIMMIVTNAYAICSLFYYGRFISGNVTMQVIAIIGFTMNFAVLIFMVALATSKHLRGALFSIGKWACKIKFIGKRLGPKLDEYSEYLVNMQNAFKYLCGKSGTFILCLVVRAITMGVYYSITFYILRALHIDVGYGDFFFVMCGSSFAITAVVFLPTPGSSGGIEFAFKSIFFSLAGGAITNQVAYGGMLIWRLLTYYLLMAASLLFYVGLEIYFNVKKRAAECPQSTRENTFKTDEDECEGQGENAITPDICFGEVQNGATCGEEKGEGEGQKDKGDCL